MQNRPRFIWLLNAIQKLCISEPLCLRRAKDSPDVLTGA